MKFLEKLDSLLAQHAMNKRTLSIKSGIPYTTIDGWYKKGYASIRVSTLICLSHTLDTNLEYWVDGEDFCYKNQKFTNKSIEHTLSRSESHLVSKFRTLDIYGKDLINSAIEIEANRVACEAKQNLVYLVPFRISEQRISAGNGVNLDHERFRTFMVNKNSLPRKAAFGIPVSGNSMEPRYHDGDIIIVSLELPDINEVGIYTFGNNEGYVKVRKATHLYSLNHDYPNIPLTNEFLAKGKVIGVLDSSDVYDELEE